MIYSPQTPGDASAPPALSEPQAERMLRARGKSLFIATPVARNPVRQYTLALLDTMLLLERLQIRSCLRWVVGNSNLPAARNELAAEFLASEFSDLLWIDDDMGWKAGDVVRLLASDKDLIGGVGRKKTATLDARAETWCCRFLPDADLRQDEMGAVEVLGVGTGFAKVSRRVFETIATAHPELKRPAPDSMSPAAREKMHRFFHFLDDGSRSVSEDFAFCELWRSLGGTIWADPTIELVHVGDKEFTGSFSVLLQPAAQQESTR